MQKRYENERNLPYVTWWIFRLDKICHSHAFFISMTILDKAKSADKNQKILVEITGVMVMRIRNTRIHFRSKCLKNLYWLKDGAAKYMRRLRSKIIIGHNNELTHHIHSIKHVWSLKSIFIQCFQQIKKSFLLISQLVQYEICIETLECHVECCAEAFRKS